MPKGRHLKPDFFTDKHMVSVSPLARILYQGLWCFAADCGHLDDEPLEFKMRILPADACDVDVLLQELVDHGRIVRAVVQGVPLIYLPTLARHARVDKRYETLCAMCKGPGEVNGARFGNHVRWHQNRDIVVSDCEFCAPDDASSHAVKASVNGSSHVVATMGTDPKPDPDTSWPHRDHIADGDGDSKKNSSSKIASDLDAEPRPEIIELCDHLADWVATNGSKRPQPGKRWFRACRLLIDVDGRTPEQVRKAIDWCQQDEFWRANVLSMQTLRDKYDQLRLKAAQKTDRPRLTPVPVYETPPPPDPESLPWAKGE